MPKGISVEYFAVNGGFIAVDRKQHDATGLFVIGRGPSVAGDITTIAEVPFEVRRLPAATPAILVPVAWQEALGMAPVVAPVAPVEFTPVVPPPPVERMPYGTPPPAAVVYVPRVREEEENPVVGACISLVCIVGLILLWIFA